MPRYIRGLFAACVLAGLAVSGLSVWEPRVSAAPPTCCVHNENCPGAHDLCCLVGGSNCSSDSAKQCLPCIQTPCSC